MLTKLLGAATALSLALAAPALAQTDADPALWVVKDADTTIYLFGTVHVLKPGLGWFDEAVKDAFDKSGEVVIEVVEPDPATMQQAVMGVAVNATGPGITEQLPADKRAAYAKALTDNGIPAEALDRFDPWFAAVTLSVLSLTKAGYDPESGAEKVLTAAAKTAGKPVSALETIEQQLGYFDSMPQPLQLTFLAKTVDELPEIAPKTGEMIAMWGAGDPDGLARSMNEEMRELPGVGKVLLTDRNARWAKWIEARMEQPGTVFVAVGAGHLAGADSVQAFLAKDKLEAERVAY